MPNALQRKLGGCVVTIDDDVWPAVLRMLTMPTEHLLFGRLICPSLWIEDLGDSRNERKAASYGRRLVFTSHMIAHFSIDRLLIILRLPAILQRPPASMPSDSPVDPIPQPPLAHTIATPGAPRDPALQSPAV